MSRSHCYCDKLTPGYPGSPANEKSWFERLLMKYVPHFDIVKDVEGPNGTKHTVAYLRRFYLWRSKWIGKNFGDLYLHKIFRSDDDPDPHTHPWDFRTFVLKGAYLDEGYEFEGTWNDGQRWDGRDEILRAPATRKRGRWHIHKVKLLDEKPAWTLVWTTGYTNDANGDAEWFFVTTDDLIPWRKYLGIDSGEHGG